MPSRKQTEEDILESLRKTVEEAEALLNEASKVGTEKAAELRSRAKEALDSVRASLGDQTDKVIVSSKAAAKAADQYVQDNPWRTAGAVGLAALLLGIIIGRK